jgi:ribosomal protein S18 acetylase RimI-like enzyme
MSDVELRPAVESDAGAVTGIWTRGWRDGHLGNVPEALVGDRTEAFFRERAADRRHAMTVAVTGGEVAGFIVVAAGEVEQVYVAAAHRGGPVAPALLAEAERQVAAAGFAEAELTVVAGNGRARRFYERHGWQEAEEYAYTTALGSGTITFPCLRYTKPLRR